MRAIPGALVALAVLVPPAWGQAVVEDGEHVDIALFEAPDRILAERLFVVNATVKNHLEERASLSLYVVLYEPGTVPCEGQRSRGTTSNAVKTLAIEAGDELTVQGQLPGEPNPWFQRIRSEQVQAAGPHQLCAWIEPSKQTTPPTLYDRAPADILVRLSNAPPEASVTVDPPSGTTATRFRFTASSQDADGDVVGHAWSFGDGATAEGRDVQHRYEDPGTYAVTLRLWDGFDEAFENVTVRVTAAGSGVGGNPLPDAGPAGMLAALGIVSFLGARRRGGGSSGRGR